MNLVEVLLTENSKAVYTRIVRYVGKSPARYKALVNIFLGGPYRVTQRAARPLSYCTELHPSLVKPYLRRIVKTLSVPGQTDSIKRNVLRLLQFVEIPKSLQGVVADVGFRLLSDTRESVAIRVFAMSVLGEIAVHQPDLAKELEIIIQDQMPYGSAGFVSRANKVLKKLRPSSEVIQTSARSR
jgi:hypothetical protein